MPVLSMKYRTGALPERAQKAGGFWLLVILPGWRDAQTQSEFEVVEIKPQALDWLFCQAASYPV